MLIDYMYKYFFFNPWCDWRQTYWS